MKQQYEAPSLKVLGSLSSLTLRVKTIGEPTDGEFFRGKLEEGYLKTIS